MSMVPVPLENLNSRALREAVTRGDAPGVVTALRSAMPNADDAAIALQAVRLLIEFKRENVAVIGAHEVFVRQTVDGTLRAVTQRVDLSVADGTLWVPSRRVLANDAGERYRGNFKDAPKSFTWRDMPVHPGQAAVTYVGLQRQNAVVGCAIVQPPYVIVDGERRENPFIQREAPTAARPNQLGAIQRIVISVAIAGPSPVTGNPVVVNYRLDYSPRTDLLHALSKISAESGQSEVVKLWRSDVELPDVGWQFVPIMEDVGYAVNLQASEVREAFSKIVEVLQMALRKATTFATRNAMKAHPAFRSIVTVDASERAAIPVTGWAGGSAVMERLQKIQSALARGAEIQGVDVIDAEGVYTEEDAAETPNDDDKGHDTLSGVPPETERRNVLIAAIDDVLESGVLDNRTVASLGFNPSKNTTEELEAILSRVTSTRSQS